MAAYISVPRDLTKVKSKVAFNLTKRQLVCFGTAALIGVPLFFVLRDSGGNTAATLGMMAVMLPAFFLGMYEKNGQPMEKLLSYYVQSRFLRPKIRPYPDHRKTLLRWDRVEKYIDLMIQSDRYLSDKERRAIDFPLELNAASAAEYTALKAQHPDTLVGFEAGGNFMFYGEDAAKVAKVLNSALFTRETALGEVQVTGFPPSLWARKSKELWSAGNDVYLAGLDEDGTHHQTKHLHKEDYSTLQQKKLTHFDCWASTFGETTTAIELAPEGTGYRARTRFAKFFNLPELMSMFKEVADIKTSDQLHLPVPVAKFETVVAKPSEIQKEMVQELSKRAADIHSGIVDASVDNMLCVTNDGRKIGLDVRLMNPMLPDDPNSKLNVCVQNVLKIWEEGKDQKLTQLLFCDLSTPKNDGNFNVYDDIRKKLIAAGVPENEIEFIHNADTEAKKAALFSKVRSGDVRVLLGSTAKMGAGTNVQSRLVAVHHLDVGWKPSDMTQRNGRIIRQGNMNKEVKVFNYVTEGTFDSYLFQTLENKQRFISQIMTSKSPVRSCEDVDEQALSYAEIKALCAGNPLIKEKMDLDVQVAKLKVLKADHQSQKFRLQDKLLTKFPADIQETNAYIAGVKADAQLAAAHPQGKEEFCGMTIKGVAYDEKKTAGERLVLACSELPNAEEKVIGSYRGFELSLRFDTFRSEYQAILKGQRRYPVPLGTDPLGNIIRLDNSLNNFPERINSAENELATLHQQQAAAQIEVEKPFPQEEELTEKSARLAELNAQLDVDEKSHEPEQDEEEQENVSRRPSVLAALEEKSDKPEPVKPFRSYYDKDGDAR